MPIWWRGCNGFKAPEEVDPKALETFRSDWCIGSESFRKSCLEQIEDKVGENHPVSTRFETASATTERLITRELVRLRWTREDLMARPKSDPSKLALAARLRRETTLTIKEIAGRLNLGKRKGAKSNLHRWMTGPSDAGSQPKLDL